MVNLIRYTIAVQKPKLTVRFFRSTQGREPVREWLKALPGADRKIVGDEIRTVQFGWPVGMPLVRKMDDGLWEVRVDLAERIVRVLFTVLDGEAVLLHGFTKKSRRTPAADLNTARRRKATL
ncbi:MAG: type II toxin-antitoxin system RelE/ParE family toxin [Gammaproteobacteria bacterium]|nr:type II toxin-antitoxin system RelE/ParE family toxin [Gammaproteobacteria bacterium]